MAHVSTQEVTDRYAIYHADCMEVIAGIPDGSVHLSVYSPPFAGLYHYSSSERDFSNVTDYAEFMEMYGYLIDEIARVTMPGRMTAVHCAEISGNGTDGGGNRSSLMDLPGDIIRAHQSRGFDYVGRYQIWKEPLGVRLRTMAKSLTHKTIVDDASRCSNAAADVLLVFRNRGDNPVPIENPVGLTEYAGERPIPAELLKYRGWDGNQIENRYSHWIWRQYASAFWDDIRLGRVLPYREARDSEDERHVHPLQLDVIHRVIQLWSNPGERVLTPFMGVGSEVYEAVRMGRVGIGAELKASYYRQAVKNLASVDDVEPVHEELFTDADLEAVAAS